MTTATSTAVPDEAAPARLRPGALWWVLALPAIGVAGYGITLQDGRPATDAVPGFPWLDELHFVAGGIALLVGVFAFRRDLLVRRTALHRQLGMVYCAGILLSGLAGLVMAVFSSGGLPAHLGFGLLAVLWLATTAMGLRAIQRRDLAAHRRWMVRSYAGCYAAVTLRVELPLYAFLLDEFELAFQLVAWTCWVFNLAFAEWWLRNTTVAGVWRRR